MLLSFYHYCCRTEQRKNHRPTKRGQAGLVRSDMSSRIGLNKRSRTSVGLTSGTRPSAKLVEFDNNRFIGPLQQARFAELVKRQIWVKKIFSLNPQGDYRDIMQMLESRGRDRLLTPPTKLNFELVKEFYANVLPLEGIYYTFCTFVRGRVVSYTRDAINQYLGNSLTLQVEQNCSYYKMVDRKK
ncbi:hypothetical protein RYX36_031513 [Vicia faba]